MQVHVKSVKPPPDIEAVASLRARLWEKGGWRPVPLYNPDQTHTVGKEPKPIPPESRGKRPMGAGWEERARRNPPEAGGQRPHPCALNTGLLADGLRILDFDIEDAAIVASLRSRAVTMFGETIVRTRGNSARCAMVYRATEGAPQKLNVVGTNGKIEVLGYGQQLHAFGPHPSGAALIWSPESPEKTAVNQIPAVSEPDIKAFLAEAATLIGAERVKLTESAEATPERQASPRGAESDRLHVVAALAVIPNNGPTDWEHWNNVGMATWAATGGSMAGFAAWAAWSERHPSHDAAAARDRWENYRRSPPTETGAGKLFKIAWAARPGWTKPSEAAKAGENAPWPTIVGDLASAEMFPPPDLPLLGVFPAGWAEWIKAAAEGKSAPADYVAMALLAVTGALIGNARWANPWEGWQEPPAINVALIGNPSAGKSPALDALTIPLAEIEAAENEDLTERKREHQTAKLAAAERRAKWEKEAKSAVGMGYAPPVLPADAGEPDPPHRRRIVSTDPTVAKAERMSAANPRGLLLARDELAGWIAGMDRYNNGAGSDRAFWLQAFGGRLWTPDRVEDGDAEISVPHLTWSVMGGIQPDRLASLLLAGDDDGLAARFLYTWPAPPRPRRPGNGLAIAHAREWLIRLRGLPWTPPEPVLVSFDGAAQAALQAWREEVARIEEGATGLFLSWLGKLPGFAVRLALIFAHLSWCEHGRGEPPAKVTEADMRRALALLAAYAVPMARRCFGEAALPEAERDARRLARWLLRQQPIPATLNVRELRRMQDGPGIATPARIKAALEELAGLGLVRPAPARDGGHGRPRNDWAVNPKVAGGTHGMG